MIRYQQYKLVQHADYESCQLFNIAEDPQELEDLGTDSTYAQVIDRLKSELGQYWNPLEAQQQLAQSKAHFSLMKQWFDLVKPPLVEEWRGNPANNYLVKE
ncbi:hypothetical protein SDC9_163100 [bioreactor metagenome]|uniref:Uncharacterized protein n=1 Tax=bioreactor metagenome TaxID=1076179 RepID=A0A645FUT1_9ZZZZ